MTYRLYYAPGTASFAVHWMLLELGVPFDAVKVDFSAGDQKRPEFLRLNPMGRVPALLIEGEAYSESAALMMMLAERHPETGLGRASGPERLRWIEAMVRLANTVQPAQRDWFYADKDGDPADADAVLRLARRRIEAAWDLIDADLADGRPYLLGDAVSTVDLLAVMHMRWSRNMERPATDWANIAPFVRRMRARPAFLEVCRREDLTEWLNA